MTGGELKKLRNKLGYTQNEFAERVNLSQVVISYYEKGLRPITLKKERQILTALGLSFDEPDLAVHLDYLRLTFFGCSHQVVMNHVIGIEPERFDLTVSSAKNYDRYYTCGPTKVYTSDDTKQGVLLELSGDGIRFLEEHLSERNILLMDWLLQVIDEDYYLDNGLYDRVQCSRIDIAIDELYQAIKGNFDLHILKDKMEAPGESPFYTELIANKQIETKFRDKPQGLTLYFGSGNGNFLIRMYEKAQELAKKERKTLAEVLEESGIVNRYELQLRKNYAEHALEELIAGKTLEKVGIDMLLSKLEVYNEVEINGKKTWEYCQDFYQVFGEFQKVKVQSIKTEKTIEISMRWIEKQVVGVLKMLAEIFGREWLHEWIDLLIDQYELSERHQNIVNGEKAIMQAGEMNGVFLFWNRKLNEQKKETNGVK